MSCPACGENWIVLMEKDKKTNHFVCSECGYDWREDKKETNSLDYIFKVYSIVSVNLETGVTHSLSTFDKKEKAIRFLEEYAKTTYKTEEITFHQSKEKFILNKIKIKYEIKEVKVY